MHDRINSINLIHSINEGGEYDDRDDDVDCAIACDHEVEVGASGAGVSVGVDQGRSTSTASAFRSFIADLAGGSSGFAVHREVEKIIRLPRLAKGTSESERVEKDIGAMRGEQGLGGEAGAQRQISAVHIRALDNPTRRETLRRLHEVCEPMSAVRLAGSIRRDPKILSHHLGVLCKMGFVRQVEERNVRGAVEKLFVSCLEDNEVVCRLLSETAVDDVGIRR